ncbi:hypothetical protein [Streptomyces paromomycinus]|uniref:Proteinase inhibitor I42 chagasin domain-containing protein n=1 Tax=Streptomyces paromomycinus TaxID=92743 RepID=A0A401W7U6_STREY|nr:hypothetical protein [Streptomyces paromomycinus]GCD45341.1 hypothetical protein GKJPGBOP_05065 [Streptomyces paromomycinus]
MQSTRLKARLAGTAATVAVLGGAALATAPAAAAKANVISIDQVTLDGQRLSVHLGYSCDTGYTWGLSGKAVKTDGPAASASGTVAGGDLTCDYRSRSLKLDLTQAAGAHFAAGDEVKVTVDFTEENGPGLEGEEIITTLQAPAPTR